MAQTIDYETKVNFITTHRKKLLEMKTILELFTSTDFDKIPKSLFVGDNISTLENQNEINISIDSNDPESYLGCMYNFGNDDRWIIYGCMSYDKNSKTLKFIKLKDCIAWKSKMGIVDLNDPFMLKKDMIENFNGVEEITSFGRFLLNYVFLVDPFKTFIPYKNHQWSIDSLESEISVSIIDGKITVEQYEKFVNNAYLIIHRGELCVPTLSEKSLTTDPRMYEYREQLLEKARKEGKIDDPLTLADIEKKLIELDKKWLEGDISNDFYAGNADSFPNHRKNMFLTGGLVEEFKKGKKDYQFITKSLAEGWQPEDVATRANEIRKASYGRGIQTAKGGEQTKYIMKMFQHVRIIENDCSTIRGLPIILNDITAKPFIGKWVISKPDNILLTEENYKSFMNKLIFIKSPQFCESKNGYCYKCAGKNIETLNIKAFGLLSSTVGSVFMDIAMKTMHNATVKLYSTEKYGLDSFFFPYTPPTKSVEGV